MFEKYRKKTVEIEAEQNEGTPFIIKTLEGDMLVGTGDWVIRGVEGELYPCKDNIFKKTYEKSDEDIDVNKPLTFGNYEDKTHSFLKFEPDFFLNMLSVRTSVKIKTDNYETELFFNMDEESAKYLIKYLNIAVEKVSGE